MFSSTNHDRVDAFVLTLALAFNDMKGVQWLIVQLDKCPPADRSTPNPERGQWDGMKLQATRLTLLILHELLKAISAAERDGALRHADFRAARGRLAPKAAHSWKDLLSLANNAPGKSQVRQYILRMRDNLTAHYYQPKALFKEATSNFSSSNQRTSSIHGRWHHSEVESNRLDSTLRMPRC